MDAAFLDWGARYFGSPGFRPHSTENVGVAMAEALSIQVDLCLQRQPQLQVLLLELFC
jgi:hypothetical protein